MTPLFLCAGCGHSVPMDQAGPTFGLCAHCEASLSNRSSGWTANHRTRQGVANQFQEMQQRQPAPPIVPAKKSRIAGAGRRKPRNRAEILRSAEKALLSNGEAKHLSNHEGMMKEIFFNSPRNISQSFILTNFNNSIFSRHSI